jgi:putative methionine-R-sulfoxide reductase with GAF domain
MALARVAVMGWATVLGGIEEMLAGDLGRAEKAARIAALIRQAGSYHWVGLYGVTDQEITAIAWSGPGPPAHPRFPMTQGLSGAAVGCAAPARPTGSPPRRRASVPAVPGPGPR